MAVDSLGASRIAGYHAGVGEAVRRGPNDSGEFHAAVAGVRPLAARDRVPAPAAPGRLAADAAIPSSDSGHFEVAPDGRSGRAQGVNRRTVRELAAGRPPVEATLDLHGHTIASARALVPRFLADARAAGRRCVLIVTGKATRSSGPVRLVDEVPAWLGVCGADVLAFTRAASVQGGDGALVVLLRGRP